MGELLKFKPRYSRGSHRTERVFPPLRPGHSLKKNPLDGTRHLIGTPAAGIDTEIRRCEICILPRVEEGMDLRTKPHSCQCRTCAVLDAFLDSNLVRPEKHNGPLPPQVLNVLRVQDHPAPCCIDTRSRGKPCYHPLLPGTKAVLPFLLEDLVDRRSCLLFD